jgi:hypothetical protein
MSDVRLSHGLMLIECKYHVHYETGKPGLHVCASTCSGWLDTETKCKYFGSCVGGRPQMCKDAETMHEVIGRSLSDLEKAMEVLHQ